jgi:tRNA(fMet)-specific endonuclease VapC
VTHLYDTDHITFLEGGTGPEYAALTRRAAAHPPGAVGYPVVSLHEQVLGAHDYINRARTAAEVVRGYVLLGNILKAFTGVPVVPFDAAAAAEFDRLRAQKVRIRTMDLRIAATARSRGLIVCTRNTADFGQVPGLVTEDWTK